MTATRDAADDPFAVIGAWEPAEAEHFDSLDPAPSRALAAALDLPAPAALLPPLWHWVHFLEWAPTSALGPDGHPLVGEFLPPIPNRTRMFVGGRYEVAAPLQIGVPARRRSRVTDSTTKIGRSGLMLFVTVRHEIEQNGRVALVDEQDIMYRSGTSAGAPVRAPHARTGEHHDLLRPLKPSETLLFRFSALTANSHRIHYDHPYVTTVEHYPGLVVHGPLLAVLLADAAARSAPVHHELATFAYRFERPCFVGDELLIAADTHDPASSGLRVILGEDQTAASANATYVARHNHAD